VALLPLFVLAAAKAQIPPTPTGSPKILDRGDLSDAGYPVEAKRNGVEGYAIVNATIDEAGRVTDVQIVELSPADTSYGFAESAERVARTMRFRNDKGQSTQVKFKVAFQLKDMHGPGAPLDGGGHGG
jgi:TonB family protein